MSDDEICGARSPSGWLCVLMKGHEGEHMTVDNTRMWQDSPGRPLFWSDSPKRVIGPVVRVQSPLGVLENKPRFTGRPCPECQSLNTIPNGKCLLCLECKHSGECA